MKNKRLNFLLNDTVIDTELNPAAPLLDFIRNDHSLKGTKEVCKEGDCGACSVLIGSIENNEIKYQTITSCIYPIGNCSGKHIVTIEGLNKSDLLFQQKVFVDEHATQCGFCTPGFIISTTAYLINNDQYKIGEAINSIAGNICRCTGYNSIKRALKNIVEKLNGNNQKEHLDFLIENNVIPEYFKNVFSRLENLQYSNMNSENEQFTYVGGGSDLFVQKPEMLFDSEVRFINELDLNYIEQKFNFIEIGSGLSFEDFKNSECINNYFSTIENDLELVASLPIRNFATIGGNLCNASPIGDLSIILLSLDCELVISNGVSNRELKIKDFYLGYKKLAKSDNEFIKCIRIPLPKNKYKFSFEKVSKRTYLDIASVNTALYIEYDNNKILNASLSAGGVSPIPLLLSKTNKGLCDKEINLQTLNEIISSAQNEISPISDVRGSSDYKRMLLNQLIKAHFLKLFPEKITELELI